VGVQPTSEHTEGKERVFGKSTYMPPEEEKSPLRRLARSNRRDLFLSAGIHIKGSNLFAQKGNSHRRTVRETPLWGGM